MTENPIPNESFEIQQAERRIWVDRFTSYGQLYTRLRFNYTSANFTACSLMTVFSNKADSGISAIILILCAFSAFSALIIHQLNKSIQYTHSSVGILRKNSSKILPELEEISTLRNHYFNKSRPLSQMMLWTLINALYPTDVFNNNWLLTSNIPMNNSPVIRIDCIMGNI